MPYIGRDLRTGAFRQLDDISSGFDGSTTGFTMQVNSGNVQLGDVNQILLSLGGVIQKPGTDFTISTSTLTFTTAPASGLSFFAILLGSDNGGTVTPTDGSVTPAKLNLNGDVGIGTTSPDARLHVLDTAASTTTHSYTKLHIEDSDHLALQFSGGTGGEQWIWFADDTTSTPVGGITYYHGGPYMAFRTEGAERMRIDGNGHITMPSQPAFQAVPASNQDNVSSGAQVVFGTERFDVNGDFASNTFTAPVTGKYQLNLQLRVAQVDQVVYTALQIESSNKTYQSIIDTGALDEDADFWMFNIHVIADMDANDTADVHFYQNGGTAQADINTESSFSGALIC